MRRAQSLPATLRNDGTYSLPRGWAMDARSTVVGQDIHPSLAQETGGAGYSNWSLDSRKSLCPPMGSAMLPCCPHAFTVLLGLASHPPWLRWEPRLPGTCSWPAASHDVCAHAPKCIGQKRRGKGRCAPEWCWSNIPALLVALKPRERSSAPMEPFSVCLSFFPLLFFSLLFPWLLTPASALTALGLLLKSAVIYRA